MANAFQFSGFRTYQRFLHGLLHTEDGPASIRTMSGVNASGFATATIVVAFVAAGTSNITITPESAAVLPPATVIAANAIAGDTSNILAARIANQIRTSPVGIYFNVTVAANTVAMVAKLRSNLYNLSTVTSSNVAALTVTPTLVPVAASALSVYRPGMIVGYDQSAIGNQGAYSVPQFKTTAAANDVCGILIHSAMTRIDEFNTPYIPMDEAVDVLTSGVVSLELAPGSAAVGVGSGSSVFVAFGGATPGRVANFAVNASFLQVNQAGQPFNLYPVAGRVTESNGLATQKFKFEVRQ